MEPKIKILVAVNRSVNNPFAAILADNIIGLSGEFLIEQSVKEFWKCNGKYDIIHIHWPESLFGWKRVIPERELDFFSEVIGKWKKKSKIVYTRHNTIPHITKDESCSKLYNIIESNADVVIHLGKFSKTDYSSHNKKYNSLQENVIIPHHIYDTIYSANERTRENAQKLLNIPSGKTVILAFGAFRHEAEKELVYNSFSRFTNEGKFLLAPSWNKSNGKPFANRNLYLGNRFVPDEILPIYFCAADIVFIQRIRILNSGNIPMGFYFNKIIVGPEAGNIGEMLDNRNNFSFDPYDNSSATRAMNNASERLKSPVENYNYAKQNWNTSRICLLHIKLYKKITGK